MKIVVLNGSPKGDSSVTMQYVAFVQKMFPQHEFEIFNIAQRIRQIETDESSFSEIIGVIKNSAAVLWAFPLYVCLVHSNYKRFIELIGERAVEAAFRDKYAAVLTTSIHFYDHTAHNYVHGICDDLGMKFFGSYSAGMHDLFKEKEQVKLAQFSQGFFDAIDRAAPAGRVFPPLIMPRTEYHPGPVPSAVDSGGKKVVIVTDAQEQDINLARMTERFSAVLGGQAEVINLRGIDIKGGCLGCIRCGYDNTCVYSGKDGFIEFYEAKIKTADVLVFAGAIHDRYLSSLWKTFFDRAFYNTHIPALSGKQVVFLISGPFGQLPNLRQIFEAYTEFQHANLAGIVTDESPDSHQTDAMIQEAALRSIDYAGKRYVQPPTFLGVGAMKLFRDEIWGRLRFPFVADHKFYRENGLYDFPQQDYAVRGRNLVMGLLIKVPPIRKKIYDTMMIEKMVEPFKKILAKKI